MPASTKHIETNVERMANDAELVDLWTREATEDRTVNQAWVAFVQAAADAGVANRIPGSTGRRFAAVYAEKPTTKEAVSKATARKAATKKTTTRKATIQKVSK